MLSLEISLLQLRLHNKAHSMLHLITRNIIYHASASVALGMKVSRTEATQSYNSSSGRWCRQLSANVNDWVRHPSSSDSELTRALLDT